MDMQSLVKQSSPETRTVVTIHPVNKNKVRVTYCVYNQSGGGIVDLPLGGSSMPPQPTGYSPGGPSINIPGLNTLEVTRSPTASNLKKKKKNQVPSNCHSCLIVS